jgi:hypothetical protein
MIFRPSIQDNITNWRVFNADTQIINFLASSETFQDVVIDDDTHKKELQTYRDEAKKLKANCVPNNVLTLGK